jgi:hypothetical protein
MTAADPTTWACLSCSESGTTDSGADKHGRETQHATLSGFPPASITGAAARARAAR